MNPYTPSISLENFFYYASMDTLFGNIWEILKFIMPILLFYLAIKVTAYFISELKVFLNSFVLLLDHHSEVNEIMKNTKMITLIKKTLSKHKKAII